MDTPTDSQLGGSRFESAGTGSGSIVSRGKAIYPHCWVPRTGLNTIGTIGLKSLAKIFFPLLARQKNQVVLYFQLVLQSSNISFFFCPKMAIWIILYGCQACQWGGGGVAAAALAPCPYAHGYKVFFSVEEDYNRHICANEYRLAISILCEKKKSLKCVQNFYAPPIHAWILEEIIYTAWRPRITRGNKYHHPTLKYFVFAGEILYSGLRMTAIKWAVLDCSSSNVFRP